MIRAAEDGDLQELKRLVQEGHDVNQENEDYGWAPLHRAAGRGHYECVEYLITCGADVRKKDWYGRAPLHCAAHWGNYLTVDVLLKHAANPIVTWLCDFPIVLHYQTYSHVSYECKFHVSHLYLCNME